MKFIIATHNKGKLVTIMIRLLACGWQALKAKSSGT